MIKDCMSYIAKRLLASIIILILFFTMVLLKDYITNPMLVSAYSTTDNTIGTYAMQVDKDLYYNDNLIRKKEKITSYGNDHVQFSIGYFNEGQYSFNNFTGGDTYICPEDQPNDCEGGGDKNTLNLYYNKNYVVNIYRNDINNINVNDIEIILVNGNVIPTIYSKPFTLGYNMGYSLFLKNSSSSQVTTNINITDTKNNINYIGSCTIPGNSNSYLCNSGNIYYLPFQFTKDDYIYFNYNLKMSFSNSNISIAAPNDSGFTFTIAQFNATAKDGSIARLKLKKNYIYNSVMYTGFNVSLNNNSGTYGKVMLARNNYTGDDSYNYDTNNGAINLISDYTSETYMNDTLTDDKLFGSMFGFMNQFVISLNSEYIEDTELSISIGSVNLGIQNSNTTSTILGNGNSDYEVYNTCSAWYDIPCQLGNAATYVIYNLPLISPLIQLIMGMVNVMKNIVIMIKWYEGLGILFSLFIFILMIRVIIMLLKGSNDDRGNKK